MPRNAAITPGAISSPPRSSTRSWPKGSAASSSSVGRSCSKVRSEPSPAAAAPSRDAFDRTMAEVARDWGARLFSRRRMMDAWAAATPPPGGGTAVAVADAMLVADGLHHNDRGYGCLAEALAEAIVAGQGGTR